MLVQINKSNAFGNVTAPPSKSMAHRYLICAALADSDSKISNISLSEDIIATIDCLKELGANIIVDNDCAFVKGIKKEKFNNNFSAFCRESGSTLRFLIPILLIGDSVSIISRADGLAKRPLDVFENLCNEKGLSFRTDNNDVILKGPLTSGEFEIPGNISSQFISGLLFALPLLYGDSTIKLQGSVESRNYIDMTIYAQAKFGVSVVWLDESTLFIKGNQNYSPLDIYVEGDYSNAAFFGALQVFGNNVNIDGLLPNSLQGDKIFFDLIDKFKAFAPVVDLSNCPDLGPVLMTVAAALNGAHFINTARLKIKESDRGVVMAQELNKFGADVTVLDNEIIVKKSGLYTPKVRLYSHGDHRIVMSLAVLSTLFGGVIEGAEAVNKSFPDFFEKLSSLGVEVKFHD